MDAMYYFNTVGAQAFCLIHF